MRRSAMLGLFHTNKEELLGNKKLKGILGYSIHEMVEFRILGTARRAQFKFTTADFGRVEFGPFKYLLGRSSQYHGISPGGEKEPKRTD